MKIQFVLIIAASFLEILFFCGIVFGWPSLFGWPICFGERGIFQRLVLQQNFTYIGVEYNKQTFK